MKMWAPQLAPKCCSEFVCVSVYMYTCIYISSPICCVWIGLDGRLLYEVEYEAASTTTGVKLLQWVCVCICIWKKIHIYACIYMYIYICIISNVWCVNMSRRESVVWSRVWRCNKHCKHRQSIAVSLCVYLYVIYGVEYEDASTATGAKVLL